MANPITERRLVFRKLLKAPEIVIAPGCADPVTARLVEFVGGFEAIHASGSVAHRTSGFSDAGLLTMSEMVSRITALVDAVNLPIIADADTGFGNVVNVVRTVREYERTGAAAMHIEDQLTPKRPSYQEGFGANNISRREMVDKIRAAVDTRIDESFVIIARSDVKGDQQEVIDRLGECIAAGADAAWLGARSADDIRAMQKALQRPMIGVLPPGMTAQEYASYGASCCVLPGQLQSAALHAQRQLLEEIKRSGNAKAYFDSQPGIDEMREFYGNQGEAEIKAIEERFGGS